MTQSQTDGWGVTEQDRLFSEVMERTRPRLRSFIRRYVGDPGEAEDILQDIFFELLEAYRMMKPIEHVTAWLFRVARNRIVDLFRRRRSYSLNDQAGSTDEDSPLTLEDLLPSADDGPDAAYARRVMLDALEDALEELPAEQREIFLAHEVAGTTFKEYAAATGVSINTLLSRKRYAVQHLRRRLQLLYEDFGGIKTDSRAEH
jgi:RNA polymerase sigma factor (sigma-70 family)